MPVIRSLLLLLRFLPLFLLPKRDLSQDLPIKPTRTISFTTDEGSYMNVDVSPDGKTLAFDLLGDLYTVPVTGGNATQLTRGIALNLFPTWSPDGKTIAYVSDRSGSFHLNIMDRSGKFLNTLGISVSDINLSFSTNPIWSPDGHFISFRDSLCCVDGGTISLGLPLLNFLHFSKNGQVIYCYEHGSHGTRKLYSYNRITKEKAYLLSLSSKFDDFQISPDDKWLCFFEESNSEKKLILYNLLTHSSRILVPSVIPKDFSYRPHMPPRHYSFSPDCKSLFITYGGKIHHIDLQIGTDTVIPFLVSIKSDLNRFNYNTFRVSLDSFSVRHVRSASASPDGKHLIFSALDKIYTMTLPDGRPKVLVEQHFAQFQPAYSTDGQWVAYVTWCDTAGGYLWRVPAAGGKPERLTNIPGQYQHPVWSQDGKFVAVIKATNQLLDWAKVGLGDIELISILGGKERIITDSIPLSNNLAFSTDGHRIIYTPKFHIGFDNQIKPQLVSKNIQDTSCRIITLGTNLTFSSSQKSISPDGRFVVYSVAEDLYLIPTCDLMDSMTIFTGDQQPAAIRFASGVDPCWEQGGKILGWTYANYYYRIDPEKIIAAAEKKLFTNDPGELHDFVAIKIEPDQIVPIDLKVPSMHAAGTIVLKNIRIITMQKGKIIRKGTIVVKDGRFMAVGSSDRTPFPPGAKILDLEGKTVMPGLIDVHLHVNVPPNLFPQQSWVFLTNLAYGVTTARDPSIHYDSYGYTELLRTGQMLGPRLYTVGSPVQIAGAHEFRLANLADAQNIVRKRAVMNGTIVKQYTLPTRIQRQWLLIACHKAGLNMTNEGLFEPLVQLGMIKDGSTGIEHRPLWGDVYKDYVTLWAASKTYFTPTLQVEYGGQEGAQNYFDHTYWSQANEKMTRFIPGPVLEDMEKLPQDTTRPNFLYPANVYARILHAGGRICLGSHGNDEGIGAHNELWALQMGGMTNMEALQCATIRGAEALGVQKDLGSIEVGKIADLIVLNSNPLDNIHNSRDIKYVMKAGILYDGDTLDEIWPEQKKCPDWRLHESTIK